MAINVKSIITTIIGSGIIWIASDYENLRANVSDLNLHFSYIKEALDEIKTDVKHIKGSK